MTGRMIWIDVSDVSCDVSPVIVLLLSAMKSGRDLAGYFLGSMATEASASLLDLDDVFVVIPHRFPTIDASLVFPHEVVNASMAHNMSTRPKHVALHNVCQAFTARGTDVPACFMSGFLFVGASPIDLDLGRQSKLHRPQLLQLQYVISFRTRGVF